MDTLEERNSRAGEIQEKAAGAEIDALDILLILVERRQTIGSMTLVSLMVGIAVSFLIKPVFTATAIIMPPPQQSSSSALLSQLGSLGSLGVGGSAALGLKTPGDLYVGILESRTIADEIIAQYQLGSVYKQNKQVDVRNALKEHTDFEAGKDGLIHIAVRDKDAHRASDLANAYVDQLYRMNSKLAITEAAQRRLFFDQQLESEKKLLASAEDDLRAMEQKTGLIQITGQTQVTIQSIAQLRARIASREVELDSIRVSSTEQNPTVIQLREEIGAMKSQLAKLENSEERRVGDISVPAGRVPEESLEYARRYREVKYHETLFDLLSRQYEAARIDEAKSAPVIQVVDRATPPDKKSGPKRLLIWVGSLAGGFVSGCIWALLAQGWRSLRKQPEIAEKTASIRAALRGGGARRG